MPISNNYTPTSYVSTQQTKTPNTTSTSESTNSNNPVNTPTTTSEITTISNKTYTAAAPNTAKVNTTSQPAASSVASTGEVTSSISPGKEASVKYDAEIGCFVKTIYDQGIEESVLYSATGEDPWLSTPISLTPTPTINITSSINVSLTPEASFNVPSGFEFVQDIYQYYQNWSFRYENKQLIYSFNDKTGKRFQFGVGEVSANGRFDIQKFNSVVGTTIKINF